MFTRRQFLTAASGSIALPLAIARPAFAMPDKQEVLFDPEAPVLGNPKGDVTIVEYFDYRCPVCRRTYPDTMSVIKADGNVRLVMKDWPIFGGVSVTAAQAALGAASIGRYPDAVQALITAGSFKTDEDVMAILKQAGIAEAPLIKAVNSDIDKINRLLDRNYRQADAFDFNGTPSYVIETAVFRGSLDADTLKHMIAAARASRAKSSSPAPDHT